MKMLPSDGADSDFRQCQPVVSSHTDSRGSAALVSRNLGVRCLFARHMRHWSGTLNSASSCHASNSDHQAERAECDQIAAVSQAV